MRPIRSGLALFHTKDYRKALDAIIEAFAISPSKSIEKDFYEIYSKASDEGCVDNEFMAVLECDNSLKKDYLKKYILTKIKSFKIDSLILRQASFTIEKEDEKTINPKAKEVLGNLEECSTSEVRNSSNLSNYHR